MRAFFAVFGKTPALSAAELFAVFGREGIKAKIRRLAAAGMIVETDRDLVPAFWDQLGGVVKAGEILWTGGPGDADAVQAALRRDLRGRVPKGRVEFGVSVYRLEGAGSRPRRTVGVPTVASGESGVGAALKKALVAEGRSARHVTDRGAQLSAVTVRKNKLLGPGVEYCLFADHAMTAIGVTAWVQDYEEFAFREFARPRADATSGMVPVKLARMLVNLAGVPRDATVLDPFCGSGTVVAEALALGQRAVVGSDLEPRAAEETEANVRWIAECLKPPGAARVLASPAEEIDKALAGTRVDAVVTEPYLGPPLRGRERPDELERNLAALAEIYAEAFRALAALLPSGAPVVFILPVYQHGARSRRPDCLPAILGAGFRLDPLLPERYRHTPGFSMTERGILYRRPGQRVLREILRLRKA